MFDNEEIFFKIERQSAKYTDRNTDKKKLSDRLENDSAQRTQPIETFPAKGDNSESCCHTRRQIEFCSTMAKCY